MWLTDKGEIQWFTSSTGSQACTTNFLSLIRRIMSVITLVQLVSILLLSMTVKENIGHGRLMDPVSRSCAWMFQTPGSVTNWDNNGLNCGFVHQDKDNASSVTKCGVCGDSFNQPQPRPNERGGTYGRGAIVRSYAPGQNISVRVEITTAHRGYFEFSICPLPGPMGPETEDCFKRYPLEGYMLAPYRNSTKARRIAGPQGINENGIYEIELQLPAGLTCRYCSFRWEYTPE
ncbi:hypothetical protein QAD02_005510 [Eretmocerus hayati]|uniref:Uncharacterized protein n=1 Tax=Eretmocerus hayati TaxID=131215 RepID=A0ACC2NTN9_9HYME|nr:hypothetical protein QAD02_005510 [Eretmocerus hayati]